MVLALVHQRACEIPLQMSDLHAQDLLNEPPRTGLRRVGLLAATTLHLQAQAKHQRESLHLFGHKEVEIRGRGFTRQESTA